jgi:hypothetical protein
MDLLYKSALDDGLMTCFGACSGNSGSRKSPIFVIIGAMAIIYGAIQLDNGDMFRNTITAIISKVDNSTAMGFVESLLHVDYTVAGKSYTKTIRTAGELFFVDQEIILAYGDNPQDVVLAPPVSASMDSWCCIGVGILLLLL